MYKLEFRKSELDKILSNVYLTEREQEVLDLWLKGKTIVEMSFILNESSSTISRVKKSIIDKMTRI